MNSDDEYMYEHNFSPLILSYHFQLGPEHPDFSLWTVSKLVAFESDIIRCYLSVSVHLKGLLCGAVELVKYLVCRVYDNRRLINSRRWKYVVGFTTMELFLSLIERYQIIKCKKINSVVVKNMLESLLVTDVTIN